MLCMKTKGQIVKEWREAKGWNTAELAKEVGTSRQNIENLERDGVGQPRYLHKLAKVMGYASTDDLLELHPPPEVPAKRRRSGVGTALQMLLDGAKPLATVQRLRTHLVDHNATRRKVIGDLLSQLAADPGNDEIAQELALQMGPPAQQSEAA